MPLINCKVELKLKLMNHNVLHANGNDSADVDPNNIICKGLELLSKGFERSVYWNEYKRKKENKNTKNE